jgi:ribonuclease-3
MTDRNTLDACMVSLAFRFENERLLEEALTHSSYKEKGAARFHNERLEFFGDSVLKLLVSEYLFHLYPDYDEGELSKIRSQLISDRFLAEIAGCIQLGTYLKMSFGEEKSGGRTRLSNLANAMEAVLGACFLDQGLASAKDLFFRLFDQVAPQVDMADFSDYKTSLQEQCQQSKEALPVYRVVNESGPDHDKVFTVDVSLELQGKQLVSQGISSTKKQAEQVAAKQMLALLEVTL